MQAWADVNFSQRTLLTFSIRSFYKNTLYCDVAPMDVSHIILGRPWQYDREVIHNGMLNTNSFMFQGRKITLLPSAEADQALANDNQRQDSKKGLLIISKSQFEDEMRTCGPIYALVATDMTTTPPATIPSAFLALIKEFGELFPNRLPSGCGNRNSHCRFPFK